MPAHSRMEGSLRLQERSTSAKEMGSSGAGEWNKALSEESVAVGSLGETDTSRILIRAAAQELLTQDTIFNLKLLSTNSLLWSKEKVSCILCTFQEIKKKHNKKKTTKQMNKQSKKTNHTNTPETFRLTRKTQANDQLFLIQVRS